MGRVGMAAWGRVGAQASAKATATTTTTHVHTHIVQQARVRKCGSVFPFCSLGDAPPYTTSLWFATAAQAI